MGREGALWIGGLEPYMDAKFIEEALYLDEMEENNFISVKVMRDKFTGEPAGYGFINFATDDIAVTVMHRLVGRIIPNSFPPVKFKLNHNSSRLLPGEQDHSIWVGDITPEVGTLQLLQFFSAKFTSVKLAKVILDDKGMSKGYGFIRFGNEHEQKSAITTMDGLRGLGSKPIKVSVKFAKSKTVNQVVDSGTPSSLAAPIPPSQEINKMLKQKQDKDIHTRGTIWGLGPVQSRMTQNAMGDEFVDQFQDNSVKELTAAIGTQNLNVECVESSPPQIKVEVDDESDSFGSYFKKMYRGVDNKITKTIFNLPGQRVSAGSRLVLGEMEEVQDKMYPGGNWELMGEMSGRALGLPEGSGSTFGAYGMVPVSNSVFSGLAQSTSDEEFRFRMGLMNREPVGFNVLPGQGDFSNEFLGLTDCLKLEEITRQKKKNLMELEQLEEAQKMKQMMELKQLEQAQRIKQMMELKQLEQAQRMKEMIEVKKMQEFLARKAKEEEEIKLEQAEKMKQIMEANKTQEFMAGFFARKVEEEEVTQPENQKNQQNTIDQLQKEVEMLKNKINPSNTQKARAGVKYRLGVTARLGDPHELKIKLSDPFGDEEDDTKEIREWSFDLMGDKRGRKRKYGVSEMPEDLVLTEMTEDGPVPAAKAQHLERMPRETEYSGGMRKETRPQGWMPRDPVNSRGMPREPGYSGGMPREPGYSGGMPRELVLTEFGEGGPVKSEMKKLEERSSKAAKRN